MKHEPALDGIRALAIIPVVFFHAFPGIIVGGWAGVDIFFVLSGYLITRLLAEEIRTTGTLSFRNFYIRRALRLVPAFCALLLFQLVRMAFESEPAQALGILQASAISAVYMMNWSRAFEWLPQDVMGHMWSLSMEEQFYLLWPATLLLIWTRRPVAWVTGALVLVVSWRCYLAFTGSSSGRTYNGFDTHCDSMLIGCLLALRPLHGPALRQLRLGAPIPLALLALVMLTMQHYFLLTQTVVLTVNALCAAWLIAAVQQDGWLRRVLSLPPLTYTGRISYGWYLWHFPILMLGASAWPGLSGTGTFLLAMASYPVAMLSFRYVERPFLALRPRFRNRQTLAPDAPAAAIA